MNSLTLLRSYIRTALRNITRYKLFSLINVLGLALSMSIGLLIITMVNELRSYDDFHKKSDRIYRVINTFKYLDEDPSEFASTSVLAGKRIQQEVPGIESSVLINRDFSYDLGRGNNLIPLDGIYASSDFFNIFTFKVLEGDAKNALKEPFSVVLTEKAADKLFGTKQNLVGEILQTSNEEQFTVTAIVEDPPFNSHLQFEVLGSFSTKEELSKDEERFLSWTNMWMFHVYVLLEEQTTVDNIMGSFAKISAEENAKIEHRSVTMSLQPLQAITPGRDLSNEIGKTTSAEIPILLSVFALIVIASACFNYTNLSIARSLKRAKEVGVRKVVGSNSGQVFYQFLIESIVFALLALVMAFAIFYLIRTPFLNLQENLVEKNTLELTLPVILQFIVFAIGTGLVAGILPASIYAKIKPDAVFRNSLSLSGYKGISLRKVLIVIQFTLSVVFIFSAIIEYRQFRFAMNFDLGYETDNILNVSLEDNDVEVVKNAFSALPEIEQISASLMVTSVGNYWGETVKYKDPMDSVSVYFNGVDANYIPLHKHKLIAGENFVPVSNDSATVQVIVNEKLLGRFNLGTPEEALGEMLKFDEKEARIVGVIGDFHYGTISHEVQPFLFKYETEDFYMLNIRFHPNTDLVEAHKKAESVWKSIDPIHPLNARFYKENLERQYQDYAIFVKIIGALAVLAIVIAALGLLGMVMFTAETRLKEISIRKVLGATEYSLVYLLGKGFLILILIASILAVPGTILLFNEFIFSDLANKVNIGVLDSLIGPLLILFIGLSTVVLITFFAAKSNPATILRNE